MKIAYWWVKDRSMSMSSDSTLSKRSGPFFFTCWGNKLRISIDHRLIDRLDGKRQARDRDRLHPAIDTSSSGDRTQGTKKRGGADILKKGPHSCISEWRVTMTDGASGDVYKRLQHLHIL